VVSAAEPICRRRERVGGTPARAKRLIRLLNRRGFERRLDKALADWVKGNRIVVTDA